MGSSLKESRNIKEPVPKWLFKNARSRAQKISHHMGESSMMKTIAEKYKHYEEIFVNKIEGSPFWQKVANFTSSDPKKIALGGAEGFVMNKLFFPIYGPIELYLITKVYQW